RVLPGLFIDSSEPGAAQALDVAARYLVNMILSLPVLYLVYVHRSALQGTGNSSWSLISGIFEALSRVVMAKLFFVLYGTAVLFWTEPFAWLTAWVFVLVPYLFYQKKRLVMTQKENAI
ncbi:MAG: MATE family efflux transporter, partial [Oscillospiraceae bacterium]|nr:MATE family efflux transporter [Oscillospiraceae bacterium]